ncbi:glutamyl-tRNA reductase [Acrasis kona]|uniref:Glutamyl-tRNA reductase n=1 Tax=Acrasis kona TaxID=1008807 RepID=A0AAW2YMP3_9EUKA
MFWRRKNLREFGFLLKTNTTPRIRRYFTNSSNSTLGEGWTHVGARSKYVRAIKYLAVSYCAYNLIFGIRPIASLNDLDVSEEELNSNRVKFNLSKALPDLHKAAVRNSQNINRVQIELLDNKEDEGHFIQQRRFILFIFSCHFKDCKYLVKVYPHDVEGDVINAEPVVYGPYDCVVASYYETFLFNWYTSYKRTSIISGSDLVDVKNGDELSFASSFDFKNSQFNAAIPVRSLLNDREKNIIMRQYIINSQWPQSYQDQRENVKILN